MGARGLVFLRVGSCQQQDGKAGKGCQQGKRRGRVACREEAANAARIQPVLEEEVLERARFDAQWCEQGLGGLLVLLDGDLIADEKLLAALVGRNDAKAATTRSTTRIRAVESRSWTNRMAATIGPSNIMTWVMASRLSVALNPETRAPRRKSPSPISMPVMR